MGDDASGSKSKLPIIILKIIELILMMCCLGLIEGQSVPNRAMPLSYVTFGALLIYCAIFVIMAFVGEMPPWGTQLFWAVVAFCLLLAVTVLLFLHWSDLDEALIFKSDKLDMLLACACLSLIAAIAFLIEIILLALAK